MSSTGNISNYFKDYCVIINSKEYFVTIQKDESSLTIILEIEELPKYYIGKFSFKAIEQLTTKSKSYKNFNVFFRMLCTSLTQELNNPCIDLISQEEIDEISTPTQSVKNEGSNSTNFIKLDRKYLVMSYENEFESVNYPLCLTHLENPPKEITFHTIRRLSSQIQSFKTINSNNYVVDMNNKIVQLMEENKRLQSIIREKDESKFQKKEGQTVELVKYKTINSHVDTNDIPKIQNSRNLAAATNKANTSQNSNKSGHVSFGTKKYTLKSTNHDLNDSINSKKNVYSSHHILNNKDEIISNLSKQVEYLLRQTDSKSNINIDIDNPEKIEEELNKNQRFTNLKSSQSQITNKDKEINQENKHHLNSRTATQNSLPFLLKGTTKEKSAHPDYEKENMWFGSEIEAKIMKINNLFDLMINKKIN